MCVRVNVFSGSLVYFLTIITTNDTKKAKMIQNKMMYIIVLVLLVIYILKIAQHLNSGIITMHTLYYSKDNNLMIIINTSGAHRPIRQQKLVLQS